MESSTEHRTFSTVDTTSVTSDKVSTNVTNTSRRHRQVLTKRTLISSIENGRVTLSSDNDGRERDRGRSHSHVHDHAVGKNDAGRQESLQQPLPAVGFSTGKGTATPELQSETLKERGIRIVDTNIKNFTNVSPEEVASYYKSLGEWQNVLPKTDYTYSPVSVYYTKKINGTIPIIPNMSRRDIWKSEEAIDNQINSCFAKTYSNSRYSRNSKTTKSRYFSLWRWSSSGRSDDDGCTVRPARSLSFSQVGHWMAGGVSIFFSKSLSLLKTWRRSAYTKTISHTRTSVTTRNWFSSLPSPTGSSGGVFSLTRFSLLLALIILLLVLYTLSKNPHHVPCNSSSSCSSSTDDSSSSSYSSSSVFALAANWLSNLLNNCSSVFVSPIYKLFDSLFSLVANIFALTYASTTFLFNAISSAAASGANIVSTVLISPLYESCSIFFHHVSARSSKKLRAEEEGNGHADRMASSADAASLEQLFQRLLDVNGVLLVEKVVGSREFVDFVDDKLKRVRDEQNDKYDTLERTFGDRNWSLEKRVEALEAHLNTLKSHDKKLDELRSRLANLKNELGMKEKRLEQVHHSVDKLSREFWNYVTNASDQLESSKKEVELRLKTSVDQLISRRFEELKQIRTTSTVAGDRVDDLEAFVKEVVKRALEVYDADKTGQVDYALESSGGVVLSTRCTETKTTNAQFSILGIPLWYTSRSPRTVIQPGVHPGECWAFPGSTGYLVIQLSERIVVTGFTLEHIPRSLASNGSIDSAPKDFTVWALRHETDPEPRFLGQFRFDADGPSLQYYEANRLDEPYQIVELKILSNHGKTDYTCLYRFRVHGIPA